MNIDGVKVAAFYATVKHAGQLYGSLPYTHHLAAVVAVLNRFECGQFYGREILAAGWLHDVVEDTPTKLKEVREMFGERCATLVDAVTKVPAENRKLSGLATYPKTRKAGAAAVALKLADRIANVENGGDLVNMYRGEYEDFRRALFTVGENADMWAHLDKLLGDA